MGFSNALSDHNRSFGNCDDSGERSGAGKGFWTRRWCKHMSDQESHIRGYCRDNPLAYYVEAVKHDELPEISK
jgi:hypothetical protein